VSVLLAEEAISTGLRTRLIGRQITYLRETGSTNDDAKRLALAGAPEGTVVIADHQIAGRGRHGRRWEDPPNSSLLLSLLFRPQLAPHQVQRLTMLCGLAVLDAVEAETGLHLCLKWPNDIVSGAAKAGGILTEVELAREQVEFVVVGIGLNVNLSPAHLSDGLIVPATSLSHLLGHSVERLPLLRALLRAVETRYLALKRGRSPHEEWVQRLATLGQPVTVWLAESSQDGVAESVDPNGALLVRLANGRLESVLAGDVTVRARH
jgi:BirA family biotin operon repressor/biotin-[acetyl-CoA-carboxylase] ligase